MAGESVPMQSRLVAAVAGEVTDLNVAALCRELGMSTKTFYKWRARFREQYSLAAFSRRNGWPIAGLGVSHTSAAT